MATVEQRPLEDVDWDELEAQLHDGGNGFGNGNFDGGDGGGGDDGDDDPDEYRDMSAGAALGGMAGMWLGAISSVVVTAQYEDRALANYVKKHNIITTPSSRPAVYQGIYNKVVDGRVEGGLVVGSMLVVSALGVVIGSKIEKRFKRD